MKQKYLTSLSEFYKIFEHNKQVIKTGDVVIVYDDKFGKLAVIKKLITQKNNLVQAALIRMWNYKTTHLIFKQYPLEVQNKNVTGPAKMDQVGTK